MDNEYYILDNGERVGPFTARELMNRPLEPGDIVLLPSQNQGVPAHTMAEFGDYFRLEGIYYPTKENTAAFFLRLPAFLIDIIIVGFGLSITLGVFLGKYLEKTFPADAVGDPVKVKAIIEQHLPELIAAQLVFFAIMLLYNALCEAGRMRGSVGKYICGLAVVDNLGYSLTTRQAMLRNLGKLSYQIPSVAPSIGIFAYFLNIAIIWNPMHQALHDRLSECFVVKKSR